MDAERWLRSELGKFDRGQWVDPAAGSRPYSEWASLWLAGRLKLSEKTRHGYRGILDSRVLPTFGTTAVSRISSDAVKEWVASMVDEGLSVSRIRNSFNVLASSLDGAVQVGMIGLNPARGVELPSHPVREYRFLDAAEVARLAAAAPTLADRALVLVLAYGGLRWGEAVALRRGRVQGRKISVVEHVVEVGGRMVVGDTKTHQVRTVHLPAFAAEVLEEHLTPIGASDLVWPGPRSGTWQRYGPYRARVWDSMVEAGGLAGLTPHDLRHTCASLMRAAGADVVEVSAQLGHRSPVVTLGVYTHLFEGAYDDLMDRLDSQHRNLAWPTGGPRESGEQGGGPEKGR